MRLLAMFICLMSLTVKSQELVFGDTALINDMHKKSAAIYGNNDSIVFALTKISFTIENIYAAEITCYLKNKIPNRLVVIYTTDSGLLAHEFVLENKQLIFCYESMGYFDAMTPKNSWRNFKHIAGYEARYYFVDEKLIAQIKSGKLPTSPVKGQLLIEEKNKLLAYLKM